MKNLKTRLLSVSMILVFMLPIFPTNIKPLVIGFLGVIVLAHTDFQNINFNIKYFLISVSVYFFLIISLIYSDNVGYGLKKLETMSSLLVFPFIFSILSKDVVYFIRKNKQLYLWVFILTVLTLNIGFFCYHILHYKSTIFVHYVTVTRIAQGGFNIHPIYLSMHISVAILFSFFIIKNETKKRNIYTLLIIDVVLLIFLLMLLKKGPIIGLTITSIVFVLLNKSKKIWSLGLAFVMMLSIAIFNITEAKKKFSELIKIQTVQEGGFTSTNVRFSIYNYAIDIVKEAPLFGQGIGDYNDKLIHSFKIKAPELYSKKYNAHNQFLSFLLSIGFVGLGLFILALIYYFKNAIVYDNKIVLCLMLFYIIVMASENILEREDGVIFFSFFMGVLPILFNKSLTNK